MTPSPGWTCNWEDRSIIHKISGECYKCCDWGGGGRGVWGLRFCKMESLVLHSGGSIFQLSFRDGWDLNSYKGIWKVGRLAFRLRTTCFYIRKEFWDRGTKFTFHVQIRPSARAQSSMEGGIHPIRHPKTVGTSVLAYRFSYPTGPPVLQHISLATVEWIF